MDFKQQYSWEFLSPDEIEQKSIRALRNHIRHIKQVSPWYKAKLDKIEPDDIKTIDDFRLIPFTERKDLEENPDSFHCVTEELIVETVITETQNRKLIPFILTATDLDRIAYYEALSFHSTGIDSSDRAQILVNMDMMSNIAMAYYRGLITLGVNTMRSGLLPVDTHKNNIQSLSPTVLIGEPSSLKKLAVELQKIAFDTRNSSVEKLICTVESLRTPDMNLSPNGKILEELWGAQIYSTYTSAETSVSYCDCTAQNGGHSHPELVFTEIIDEKGASVPDGTTGELVATPLGVEGMPLLRYKTGDITFAVPGKCPCGRNSIRIGPILGIKSQIFKLGGTTVYPLAITNALDQLDEVKDYILIVENESSFTDRVFLHVAAPASCIEKISNQIRTAANVSFPILISNTTTIQALRKNPGKNLHILDCRKKG
ncbi:MAG TPA: hypothetical protein VKY57_12540 [Chitinispirillaceae bacterium]|nr:hypothetical protein [Chitinispirillaceae bacterium]